MGVILTAVSFNGPDVLQAFCDGQVQSDQLKFISNEITSIDTDLSSYIDSYMCSYNCQCPASANSTWTSFSESDLNAVGRTKVFGTTEFDSNSRRRLFFASNGTTYSTFKNCSTYLVTVNSTAKAKASATSSAMALMSYFESKYTCSGICNPALWYYSLNLSVGIPTKNCLIYLKQEVGDHLVYLGITSLVTGFILFFVWICQYCLWKKFK